MFFLLFVIFGSGLVALNQILLTNQIPDVNGVSESSDLILVPTPIEGFDVNRDGTGSRILPTVSTGEDHGALIPATPVPLPSGSEFSNISGSASVGDILSSYRDQTLLTNLRVSLIGLAILSGLAGLAAWWVARRALRPIVAMSETAQRIGVNNLTERLPVMGPRDELRTLGETVNETFDRLADIVSRERRLVANTSHELRTPIANQRVLIEMAIADPQVSKEQLRDILGVVFSQTQRQEDIINGMFDLARGQSTELDKEPVSLDECVRSVLSGMSNTDLQVTSDLVPAGVVANPTLLTQAIQNLVINAQRHNLVGGWIHVQVTCDSELATLSVTNPSVLLSDEKLLAIREPFRRGSIDRTGATSGAGLGLAIVEAITNRYGWSLSLGMESSSEELGNGSVFRAEIQMPTQSSQRTIPSP